MRDDSKRDYVQTGGNNYRNYFASWQNHRERPRPEMFRQFQDQLSIWRGKVGNLFEPIAVRQMDDQRIETRAFFGFEDLDDRVGLERVSGEAVNCFGRQGDD